MLEKRIFSKIISFQYHFQILHLPISLICVVQFFQMSNRLVKEVGNAAKETDLTFKYKAKDPKKKIEKDSLPFQVL